MDLPQDSWVIHPDGRIFCRSWLGDAALAPIVLFHDSLGSVELWRDFPASLAEATGRTVIAYDRLGFGKSDARIERPSLDFIAEEAKHVFPVLREQLDLQRFVAMGHSVGGGMAVHCAAAFPQDCEALITESAQMFAEDRTLASIRVARDEFDDPAQLQRLARYHGDKARWVLEAWTECWLDPDFESWTLVDVLPRVMCPVLAVHGGSDEYGSVRHPEMIAQRCTGPVTTVILEEMGHVPHRQCPEVVLERVARFLQKPRMTE